MAIGMKSWLGIVAASMAVVALWGLPPRGGPARVAMAPEHTRALELVRQVRAVHAAIQAGRWADSLSELTVHEAVDGLALGVPDVPDVTSEGIAEWRSLLDEQLAALERRDTRLVLGFFFQPPGHAAEPGLVTRGFSERTTFVGTRDGQPFCFQVDAPTVLTNLRLRDHARAGLGACRLYARYGLAGSRIQEWLDAGALGFGLETGEHRDVRYRPMEFDAPLFGLNRVWSATLEAQACRSERPDACVRAVTDPEVVPGDQSGARFVLANSPVSHLQGVGWVFGPNDHYILADLEAEFGAEAFARFWTSEQAVAEAFAAAFGVGLGEWVLRWVEAESGLNPAGPLPSPGSALLSFLTLVALNGGASVLAMRRRAA